MEVDRFLIETGGVDGDGPSLTLFGPEVVMVFDRSEPVDADALVGRSVTSGSELIFTEMRADGNCPASLSEQDSFVIGVLGDGFVPTVDDDRLTVRSVGDQVLGYRLSSEDEVASLPGTEVVSDAEALNEIEWTFVGGDSPDRPIARYLNALPNMSEGGVEGDGERLVMNGNEIELRFERVG